MSPEKIALVAIAFSLSACAETHPTLDQTIGDCPQNVQALFDMLEGEWTLSIQADEGWTGYGTSRMSWATDQKCGLIERSVSVFNQESDTPFENRSTTHLVYDELSETLKVLTSDARGYVHIGIAVVEDPLNFDVLKPNSETPNRRIQYQNIQPDSFEWRWKGRDSAVTPWEERLAISYRKERANRL